MHDSDPRIRAIIIASIRRAYRFSGLKSQALARARIGRGLYRCEKDGATGDRGLFQVDHIEPVVPVTGFVDWNTHMARQFCALGGLQVLCLLCHKEKTRRENEERRKWRTPKAKKPRTKKPKRGA